MMDAMVRARGVRRGESACRVLEVFLMRASQEPEAALRIIPEAFWWAQPTLADEKGEERLLMRGAVLVRIHGRRPNTGSEVAAAATGSAAREMSTRLTPELVAALEERPVQPWRKLLQALRADDRLIFMEHGRAPEPEVARQQDRLAPVFRTLAGCNPNRPMAELIAGAGVRITSMDASYLEGRRNANVQHLLSCAHP